MIDEKKEKKTIGTYIPKEAQLFLTFDCNYGCGYCGLPEQKDNFSTISVSEWIEAIKNLSDIGVEVVKILGGEPTKFNNEGKIEDIIRGVKESGTDVKISMVSNGQFYEEGRLKGILESGLDVLVCSLDTLPDDEVAYCPASHKKSLQGFKVLSETASKESFQKLKLAREHGVMPVANTVITKKNLFYLLGQCKSLADEDIYVNLCPVIYGGTVSYDGKPSKFHFRKENMPDSQYQLVESEKGTIQAIMSALLHCKHSGDIKLLSPDQYLEKMHIYSIKPDNWQCSMLTQYQVAPNGELYLCNEFIDGTPLGINVTKPLERDKIIGEWHKQREKTNCSGCAWSTFVIAEDNFKNQKQNYDVGTTKK